MSDYRVADGHDVALGSLTVLSPQPRSPGLEYTEQTFSLNGTPNNQAPYVTLVWTAISETQYDTIMTAFGLAAADYNDVTVYIRDENFNYARKNGRAIKPLPGRGVNWDYFPRNLEILVRNLENAA